jgi:3',5'-nucleoside bisphosphate phosphatase
MSRLLDLHTHSHHSDGTLAPVALAQAAAARGVTLLALTDHDTTAGLAECAAASSELGMKFVSGVEITALWRGQEIHVVGLGIDPTGPLIMERLARIVALRHERVGAILGRLRKVPRLNTEGSFGAGLDGLPIPTRTHVARELVARGVSGNAKEAFEHWLARGKSGYVPPQWPALESAIEAIVSAGGHAVLAHPQRYRLSSGGRRALLEAFSTAGGAALELDLPGMSPSDVAQLAGLARSFGLAGSAGSDFHEPGLPWRALGRFAKLPEGIEPLWMRFSQAPVG